MIYTRSLSQEEWTLHAHDDLSKALNYFVRQHWVSSDEAGKAFALRNHLAVHMIIDHEESRGYMMSLYNVKTRLNGDNFPVVSEAQIIWSELLTKGLAELFREHIAREMEAAYAQFLLDELEKKRETEMW